MIETLPCSSCTALCCGPVTLTADRLKKIRAYIEAMPLKERKRLAGQKREPFDCGFLDKQNHRCAVYPVRPWVCEAFGRVEGLQCPKVTGLVERKMHNPRYDYAKNLCQKSERPPERVA